MGWVVCWVDSWKKEKYRQGEKDDGTNLNDGKEKMEEGGVEEYRGAPSWSGMMKKKGHGSGRRKEKTNS